MRVKDKIPSNDLVEYIVPIVETIAKHKGIKDYPKEEGVRLVIEALMMFNVIVRRYKDGLKSGKRTKETKKGNNR